MFSLNFKIKIVKCAVPPYMIPMLTPVLAVIDRYTFLMEQAYLASAEKQLPASLTARA